MGEFAALKSLRDTHYLTVDTCGPSRFQAVYEDHDPPYFLFEDTDDLGREGAVAANFVLLDAGQLSELNYEVVTPQWDGVSSRMELTHGDDIFSPPQVAFEMLHGNYSWDSGIVNLLENWNDAYFHQLILPQIGVVGFSVDGAHIPHKTGNERLPNNSYIRHGQAIARISWDKDSAEVAVVHFLKQFLPVDQITGTTSRQLQQQVKSYMRQHLTFEQYMEFQNKISAGDKSFIGKLRKKSKGEYSFRPFHKVFIQNFGFPLRMGNYPWNTIEKFVTEVQPSPAAMHAKLRKLGYYAQAREAGEDEVLFFQGMYDEHEYNYQLLQKSLGDRRRIV